jgi:ribokinase
MESSHKPIVVVGSVNMDLMLRCPHLPTPGETVMGREFERAPGGKGSNQAVAAARLGALVSFIGCVGEDEFGCQSRSAMEAARIDTVHLHPLKDVSTGIAMITADDQGENCIAIAPGANHLLSCEHLDQAETLIAGAALVVCQFESPLATVLHTIGLANRHRVPVLLNPAPAKAISLNLLVGVDVLVLNTVEAEMLLNLPVKNPHQACYVAEFLRSTGIPSVIVTLGKEGVVVADAYGTSHRPAPVVTAVDSTGAGDTFVGALSGALVAGVSMAKAVEFAQRAAAFSVTKFGAQASMPFLSDLEELDRAPLEVG